MYAEVAKLTHTTLPDIVAHLKSIYQDMVYRTNLCQKTIRSSRRMYFPEDYAFTHITTSPSYTKANGVVERAVQTVKQLLKKAQVAPTPKEPFRPLPWRTSLVTRPEIFLRSRGSNGELRCEKTPPEPPT